MLTPGERPWYRVWPGSVPKKIDYPEVPIAEILRQTAMKYPDRTAVHFHGMSLSYREIDSAADRFAASLQRAGVKPRDRVSLLLANTPHFIISFYGVMRAGGIVVQTSPLYTPRELEDQYNDSGVETAVCLDLFWHNLAKVRRSTGVRRVVICDVAEFLPAPKRWLYPLKKRRDLRRAGHWPVSIPQEPWVYRYPDLVAHAGQAGPVNIDIDDVAVLQYTGGTTGIPKGAMLTHRNLVASSHQASKWSISKTGYLKGVLPVPLFHIYGLNTMLASVVVGGTGILEPNPRDTTHLLELVKENDPNFFFGVSTLYVALLNNPKIAGTNMKGLEKSISGGAPIPQEVRSKWEALTGGRVYTPYGMSEAALVTFNPTTEDGRFSEGVGIPVSDTDVRIVDMETGTKDLPVGEAGEIIVKGPQVMKGYWNKPKETSDTLRNGWLFTGDIGKMDENGIIYIVERKKDMIDASGFKVYPQEVEEVLYSHPAVMEASVIGVPDAYRGETVKAYLVKKPGSPVVEEDIVKFCKERLAPYKVPKIVEFIDVMPMSIVGKVLRRELRERERLRTANG